MMKPIWTAVLAGFAALPAGAAPIGFTPPETVKMFTEGDLIKGAVTEKGGDCDAAVKAALADAVDKAAASKMVPIAAFPWRDWEPFENRSEMECEYKGDPADPKKTTAKVGLLAVRPGEGQAFAELPTDRVMELYRSMISTGAMVDIQIGALDFEEFRGGVYLHVDESPPDEPFGPKRKRNMKAVTLWRASIQPSASGIAGELLGFPEIRGTAHTLRYSQEKKEEEGVTYETMLFYVPSDAAKRFGSGEITEQQLNDASTVMLIDGVMGSPVKIDVDFTK